MVSYGGSKTAGTMVIKVDVEPALIPCVNKFGIGFRYMVVAQLRS